jgi:Asp/Glu/hydantoin racemase
MAWELGSSMATVVVGQAQKNGVEDGSEVVAHGCGGLAG